MLTPLVHPGWIKKAFLKGVPCMILQCQTCSKVKKFGEWIEIPEGLRELIKDLSIIHTFCPRCEGLTVSSSLEKPVVPTVCVSDLETAEAEALNA